MHRVARLEGHDLAPAELAELFAQLGGTVAEVLEIVMGGRLDPAQLAADVNGIGNVVEVVNGGMGLVGRAVHALRFRLLVRRPDIADVERGNDHALEVAQCNAVAALYGFGKFLADIERNRHRPEDPGPEAHVRDDRLVIVLVEKSFERRERAVQQQLDVAQLALGQVP